MPRLLHRLKERKAKRGAQRQASLKKMLAETLVPMGSLFRSAAKLRQEWSRGENMPNSRLFFEDTMANIRKRMLAAFDIAKESDKNAEVSIGNGKVTRSAIKTMRFESLRLLHQKLKRNGN